MAVSTRIPIWRMKRRITCSMTSVSCPWRHLATKSEISNSRSAGVRPTLTGTSRSRNDLPRVVCLLSVYRCAPVRLVDTYWIASRSRFMSSSETLRLLWLWLMIFLTSSLTSDLSQRPSRYLMVVSSVNTSNSGTLAYEATVRIKKILLDSFYFATILYNRLQKVYHFQPVPRNFKSSTDSLLVAESIHEKKRSNRLTRIKSLFSYDS